MDNKIDLSSALTLDCAKEADKIAARIRDTVSSFKRQGVIVALSGGIDSSVVGALSVHALGKDRVFGLLMPEPPSLKPSAAIAGATRPFDESFRNTPTTANARSFFRLSPTRPGCESSR